MATTKLPAEFSVEVLTTRLKAGLLSAIQEIIANILDAVVINYYSVGQIWLADV